MAFRALSMVLLLQTVLANPIHIIQNADEKQQQCAHVHEIKGQYFVLDETRSVSDIPANMHIDWKTGNLYYSATGLHVIYKDNGLEKTVNVNSGKSITIDTTNNVVYFATGNGVYKLNDKNDNTELYAASEKDVVYVAVTKDGSTMYISTSPDNQVYKLTQDGKNEEMISAIPSGARLTVDPKGNLFYTATSENVAFVLKAGESVPEKIQGVPDGLVLDFYIFNDKVYGMDQYSNLYEVNGEAATATDLGSLGGDYVNTFAISNASDLYLGVEGAIKKFKHYPENPCKQVYACLSVRVIL